MPTARNRAAKTVAEVLDPAEHFVPNGAQVEFDEPESSTDRIAVMLGELRGDDRAKVKLYKIDNGLTNWCEDMTPDAFEQGGLPMIRAKWGPGAYRIVLYGTREGGNYGIRARDEVRLMPGGDDALLPVVRQQGAMADVLAAIHESNRQQAELMRALIDKLGDRPDPQSQMKDTLALMTSMREAMGLSSGNGTPTMASVLADIKAFQKAAHEFGEKPDAKDKGDVFSQLLPMLPQVLDAIQSRNAGGAPHAYVPPVALPPAIAMAGAPASPPAPASGPAESGSPGGAATPTPDQSEQAELMQMFGALIFYNNGLAKRGADPVDSAGPLYQQLPDEVLDLLGNDQWWDYFKQMFPTVEPYREWYAKARDEVLRLIAEDAAAPKTD